MTGPVERLRTAGCVLAEEEARLIGGTARTRAEQDAMVARRVAGLPLEHVLGWAELDGLRVAVEAGVFVPRRRSEALVRRAAARAPDPTRVVLDLCCGTGALGLALARRLAGPVALHAADHDPAAVACARRNGIGAVHQGDLWDALPATLRGRLDVVVVSAPYVPRDRVALLPPEAREHEPRAALDGGPDGLDVLRRVAADAAGWLAPGGLLATEVGAPQGPDAAALLRAAGLATDLEHDDEADTAALIARRGSEAVRRRSAASLTGSGRRPGRGGRAGL